MNWMKKSLNNGLLMLLVLFSFESVARDIVLIEKDNPAPKNEREALLILPGFGTMMHNTKSQRENFKDKGYDLYIPDYISRKSMQKCADNVSKFYQKHRMDEYKKVHVLSYIIGSWTLNTILSSENPPSNIETIIYDRSPMQEMAPPILVDENPFLSRLLFGKLIKELATTPYQTIVNDARKVAVIMECKATKLMYKKRESLKNYPEVGWTVASRGQDVDDAVFLYINHDDMYTNVQLVAPAVFHFIQKGEFPMDAQKTKCTKDPFVDFEK